MKKFSKEHQWIEIAEDGSAKVGITQYASGELGEVTFVELPEVGKSYQAGEQLCSVESVKACSDVFMPACATVAEINSALENDCAPVNDDPEGAGWLCVVQNVKNSDLDALMDESAYAAYVASL